VTFAFLTLYPGGCPPAHPLNVIEYALDTENIDVSIQDTILTFPLPSAICFNCHYLWLHSPVLYVLPIQSRLFHCLPLTFQSANPQSCQKLLWFFLPARSNLSTQNIVGKALFILWNHFWLSRISGPESEEERYTLPVLFKINTVLRPLSLSCALAKQINWFRNRKSQTKGVGGGEAVTFSHQFNSIRHQAYTIFTRNTGIIQSMACQRAKSPCSKDLPP